MTGALDYAKRLIAAPSVTPATGAVFDEMEAMLAPLGFAVHRKTRGDGEEGSDEAPVENLFAIRHGPAGSKHFAFAGHLDVVPPGEGGHQLRSIPKNAASCSSVAARSI